MYKIYSSAPLPFMGHKRRFIKDFKGVLTQIEGIDTVVDLFGGSGLLSHVAKRERCDLRVIYNDYDYYCKRIENVTITNEILAHLRQMVKDLPDNKRIPDGLRREILEVIAGYDRKGYVDYLTLGSSLLFSGKWVNNYEELSKHTMYNCMRQTDYCVDGYLDDLEIAHMDYRELFARHKDNPHALFLIDPPYLSTEVGAYKCYWKLKDYLDVLKLLNGTNYIYFTSEKSQVIELCEWLRSNPMLADPFEGTEIRTQNNKINYGSGFKDIMLIKQNLLMVAS